MKKISSIFMKLLLIIVIGVCCASIQLHGMSEQNSPDRMLTTSELKWLDTWLKCIIQNADAQSEIISHALISEKELQAARAVCDFYLSDYIHKAVIAHQVSALSAFLKLIENYHPTIIPRLFKTYFKPLHQTTEHVMPLLHMAIAYEDPKNPLTAFVLLEHHAPNDGRDSMGMTPFHWAARRKSYPLLNMLAEFHDLINAGDCYGRTALHNAIKEGQLNMAWFLIDREANPEVRDHEGMTSLNYAAAYTTKSKFDENIFNKLIIHGAHVNSPDKQGRTPLHYAAARGNNSLGSLLLSQKDIEINHQDKFGQTPLHMAARYGQKDSAALIVSYNDSAIDVSDQRNRTPVGLAKLYHQGPAIISFLISVSKKRALAATSKREQPAPNANAIVNELLLGLTSSQ